jgi:hypothetical protein
MTKLRILLAAVLVLAASVLIGAVVFEGGPDAVVYPRQRNPLWFNHDYHVRTPEGGKEGEGLKCDFCHDSVGSATTSSDRNIPGHSSCDNCHEKWIGDDNEPAPRKECAHCHKDLADPSVKAAAKMVLPRPNINFAHSTHVKADIGCKECHSKVSEKELASRDDFPTMDRCIACHLKSNASTECRVCHPTAASGRLVTSFTEGRLEPRRFHQSAIHDGDFLRAHAVPAQRNPAYCKTCHGEDDCLRCHDGLGRDTRYHPNDWIAIHYIKAREDDVRCQSCHRLQTFCINCHVRSGVATVTSVGDPFTPTRQTIRVDSTGLPNGPHPMGDEWVKNVASKNFHGFHAQRNIASCASCHQEQYCLRCHMSAATGHGGIGGNPHGPHPERLKGSAASRQDARMCLKCHSPSDPKWR